MECSEFSESKSERLADYMILDPMNQEPVNMFYFNAHFVEKIELGFKASPIDFDHASNPVNMTVNAVHYGNPNSTKPNHPRPNPPPLFHFLSPSVSPCSSPFPIQLQLQLPAFQTQLQTHQALPSLHLQEFRRISLHLERGMRCAQTKFSRHNSNHRHHPDVPFMQKRSPYWLPVQNHLQ